MRAGDEEENKIKKKKNQKKKERKKECFMLIIFIFSLFSPLTSYTIAFHSIVKLV